MTISATFTMTPPPTKSPCVANDTPSILATSVATILKINDAQHGRVEDTIGRKKRATPPVEPKVTGDVEARVIALACSQPPPGRQRWTLRLLERHVALTEGMPPMDHSTIGRVLKRGR